MIISDFNLLFPNVKSASRITPEHRYLAQDSGGSWYIYRSMPIFNNSGGYKDSHSYPHISDWVAMGTSSCSPTWNSTIIDLHTTIPKPERDPEDEDEPEEDPPKPDPEP